MSTTTNHPKKVHEGRNVKRFREMLNIKQEGLAYELGGEWTQKRISVLESKEKIEDDVLAEIAKVLKVPEQAIRNFDEETAIYNIQNNYDNSGPNSGPNYECIFNPLEKVFELVDEIKKLHAEKEALYERLLMQSEKKG